MENFEQKRKRWFKILKKLTTKRYKKVEFEFRGEKVTNGAIIISNHEGTDAPMSLELYADFPIRFWGTSEMNEGLIKMYKYQSRVYYHEKKHWNLFLARLFCLIASPLTNLFYKGLNLISTYKNAKFKSTLKESIEAIKMGDNIVIFPEKSPDGYKAELEGFYQGFILLAETLFRRKIDVSIFVSYFIKSEKKYIFDAPIKYSELKNKFNNKDEMTDYLLEKCNTLYSLNCEKLLFEQQKTQQEPIKEQIESAN